MDNVKKLAVVPYKPQPIADDESPITEKPVEHPKSLTNEAVPPKGNRIREHAARRILNLFKVTAKLAKINAYDENLRIQGPDGRYLHGTDVGQLLNHAMSPGKVVNGETEFLLLLSKANVEPSLIMNESLRRRLETGKTFTKVSAEPVIREKPYEMAIKRFSPPSSKRRYESSDEEIEEPGNPKKRKISWDYPSDGEDSE